MEVAANLEVMSNSNSFTKFRILTFIFSGLLLLWLFFDADLSKSIYLQDLGIQDSKILAYILVALISFTLFESILGYTREESEGGWQPQFQFIFVIVFSLCALITSYPKLVMDTILHETTRLDLILPFGISVISSVSAVYFRVSIEVAQVFYRFRKRVLPSQWIELAIFGLVVLIGIAVLMFLSSDVLPVAFATRIIVFIASFVILFFVLASRKKIFDESQLTELSEKSDYYDRQVELSDFALSAVLKKPGHRKKLHKHVMRIIEEFGKKKHKNLKSRFRFLEEVQFRPVGNYFEPLLMEAETEVLCV